MKKKSVVIILSALVLAGSFVAWRWYSNRYPRLVTSGNSNIVSTAKPGDIWIDPTTGMEFVWLPGGCFTMGSPATEPGRRSNEWPEHEVCVDGLWMGKYEVTNAQYRLFHKDHSSREFRGYSLDSDNQPVLHVRWDEAMAYSKWMTANDRVTFRLPTEAEWEYAARANSKGEYYWENDQSLACNYENVYDISSSQFFHEPWKNHSCNDGYIVTGPIGSFKSNAFGLFDMLGNASEWCLDDYVYASKVKFTSVRMNPVYRNNEDTHVVRGGCWRNSPTYTRISDRNGDISGMRSLSIGFRLVMIK